MHTGFTRLHAMMRPRLRKPQIAQPTPQVPAKSMPKEKPMKRLAYLLLLSLFSMGTLTACNTMAGAGEDVQEAGEALEDEAEGHIDCDTSDEC